MSRWERGLGLLIALSCSPATAVEPDARVECESVDRCLALVPETLGARNGISQRESALATRVQSFGAAAIPELLDMLSAPDEKTRDFAGYTLGDIDGLAPEHVAPILRAALAEPAGGWLPPALARIGTPEAVAGLVSLVRKYPEQAAASQIGHSFARLRAQGVPGLLELITDPESPDVRRAASAILAQIDPNAGGAAGTLATIAADRTRPEAVRLDVLRALGEMGPGAASAHDALMNVLQSSTGDYQRAVARALAAIGGSGLREIYDVLLAPPKVPFDGYVTNRWEDLEPSDYWYSLAQIAFLGERGRDAVPALLKLLHDPHPNLRVDAARVLGFVGDASVGPQLVALIQHEDWLMVRTVVESLGRIRYQSARGEIALVASGHWYPPVRAIAKQAEAALDGTHRYEAPSGERRAYAAIDPEQFPFELPKACATTARYPSQTPGDEHFESDLAPDRAKRFSYQYDLRAYYTHIENLEDEEDFPRNGLVDQVPGIGLRGPDGWFLGSSRGEFGGELVWRPDRGADQVVVRDNIEDVYELSPRRFVTTAGLAHLGLDSGHVYRLERSNGRWRARWWLRLPGTPMRSWRTTGGQIVIDTTNGSVLLDRDGVLRMAECSAKAKG